MATKWLKKPRELAEVLDIRAELVPLLDLAGRLHDWGKAHPAFQSSIIESGTEARPERQDLAKAPREAWVPLKELYSKDATIGRRRGFRHELASTLALFELLRRIDPHHQALLGEQRELIEAGVLKPELDEPRSADGPLATLLLALDASAFNLLAYLVCCHHGKVRGTWQSTSRDQEFPSLDFKYAGRGQPLHGVRHGDVVPATLMIVPNGNVVELPALTLHLDPATLGLSGRYGSSWTERVQQLFASHGPFTLAYLEAILRVADVRASRTRHWRSSTDDGGCVGMTVHVHHLTGCSPTPLAHYLKALGILRLVSNQKDSAARGWWKEESFHLATTLDGNVLLEFFLEDYEPTPLVAPWNGGSGFYPNDNKDGIAAIAKNCSDRFAGYRKAIEMGRSATSLIKASPKNEAKSVFLRECRQRWSGPLLEWLEAAVVLDGDGEPVYPALLGTGGNDGRLDFTNNFMQRLAELVECEHPQAPSQPASLRLLDARCSGIRRPVCRGAPWDSSTQAVQVARTAARASAATVSSTRGFCPDVGRHSSFVASLARRTIAHASRQAAAPFAVRSSLQVLQVPRRRTRIEMNNGCRYGSGPLLLVSSLPS